MNKVNSNLQQKRSTTGPQLFIADPCLVSEKFIR